MEEDRIRKIIGKKKQEDFYRILDYTRRKRNVSFREVERQTGVKSSTISRLAHGKEIQSFDLFCLFHWIEK